MKYVDAIRAATDRILSEDRRSVVLGQGLWSPFYVGRSMTGLDKKHGPERVIDTPVSENGTTGIALGLAIAGARAIVVHPRMDFMILSIDQIVNEAAKWRYVLGREMPLSLTIRGIINRGGEQGAQHSQALHSWFSHVPGLRVVMPATPRDAYELLLQSVYSEDPVIYVEDRWCYEFDSPFSPTSTTLPPLAQEKPRRTRKGTHATLVGLGYTSHLCALAADALQHEGVSCEVFDMRVLNPIDVSEVATSVVKTGRLVVVDGAWKNASMASEIVAAVAEAEAVSWKAKPVRLTLPDAPAPSSRALEHLYYPTVDTVTQAVRDVLEQRSVKAEETNTGRL